jgi:hypothetical protein
MKRLGSCVLEFQGFRVVRVPEHAHAGCHGGAHAGR